MQFDLQIVRIGTIDKTENLILQMSVFKLMSNVMFTVSSANKRGKKKTSKETAEEMCHGGVCVSECGSET